MEKTEMMELYEETTYYDDNPKALIQIIEYLKECIQDYKAKASAYDRLMSGKKTLKDLANILRRVVAVDYYGNLLVFYDKPIAMDGGWIYKNDQGRPIKKFRGEPLCTVIDYDYNRNWKDSLTLPDGWEEK